MREVAGLIGLNPGAVSPVETSRDVITKVQGPPVSVRNLT